MLNKLNSMMNNTESELTKEVIAIILDEAGESNEEIIGWLENVTTFGCASGTVCSLIYYSDTEPFFDRHADEILEIVNNYIDMADGRVTFELTRNNMAWIGFEHIAQSILDELETANEF